MRQRVLFGSGAARRLPAVLAAAGYRRVLLVTGRHSFAECGAADIVGGPDAGHAIVGRFWEFAENPPIEDVERGVRLVRDTEPDAIVGIGGGSVLDVAKLLSVCAGIGASPREVVLGRVGLRGERPGLIAVPTTAGSGSEATHFAVVYMEKTKYSVAAPALLPDTAIVDPRLTWSLSPRLTAVTGLDAFAQAVESYWSVHSTGISKAYARRAIVLVLESLREAVRTGAPRARRGMSKAAHLAGRAINITKTTGAHAISYPLTSYFGIPHGLAVGLTLGQWLLFNSEVSDSDVVDPRGAEYVRGTVAELASMMGCRSAEECCGRIEELTRDVGLPTRLSTLGVSRAQALGAVVPNVNAERLVNNPRALTTAHLEALLGAVC